MGMLRNLNQSFSGKTLCTTPEVGVVATSIPSTGTDGPPYAYNDLVFPADNNKLVRGFITTFPSAGTLTAYDDTSFTFSGAPNGSYTFVYELRLDDVLQGTGTVTLDVGNPITSFAITLDNLTTSISVAGDTHAISMSGILDDVTTSLAVTGDIHTASMSGVIDDVITTFSGYSNITSLATISVTLDDNDVLMYAISVYATTSITNTLDDVSTSLLAIGYVNSLADISITTDNTIFAGSASDGVTIPAQITITLDDVEMTFTSFGSRPPDIVGPEARLPIPLGITLDGQLIILC